MHFRIVDAELLRTGEHHHRRCADHDRAGHRLTPFAVLEPMHIAAGAAAAVAQIAQNKDSYDMSLGAMAVAEQPWLATHTIRPVTTLA